MRLNNEQLYEFFQEKNISYMYHANTLATSVTFIQQGGLMSRGKIEKEGLFQTKQSSDEDDKVYKVWNDIFLDTVDLHGFFPRQNLYGPISFKINISFLINTNCEIWITKNNPIYWNPFMTNSQKYFTSIDELKKDWNLYERQRKMITIRDSNNPILFDFLEEIVADDPRVRIGDIICSEECLKALHGAIGNKDDLNKQLKIRNCTGTCYCRDNYLKQLEVKDLERLFFPIDKQN